MKILYYDCFAGISGDMNLGALLDLGVDKDYLIQELAKLSIADEFHIEVKKTQKMGITGTKVDVILTKDINTHVHDHKHNHEHSHSHGHNHNHDHTHHHEHRNLNSINAIIDNSQLNENVKRISKDIFNVVSKAEAKVHGKSIDEVHFHEVGAIDSIVDIIGAAICIDSLKVDRIIASTIELGGGFVKCAHGLIPIPAPATTEILKDIPTHIGRVNFETTTPTGAAILKSIVDEFTDAMNFKIIRTGYGLGTKDFEIPNVLRVFLAESTEQKTDYIIKENTILEVNIDDMNPELFGFIEEKLFEKGALDVYRTPIVMKKGRIATKLSILVDDETESKIENILLQETSTLGIRKYKVKKKMLKRYIINICTKYGEVPVKLGMYKGEILKFKPEFEVCKRLAKDNNVLINDIYKEVNKVDIYNAWKNENGNL